MKSLSAQALAQKALDGVNCVWMADAALDEFGLATVTFRWGTRAYTIGATTYEDLFVQVGGLDITESTVAAKGGLATVGSLKLIIADEEGESAIIDQYVVINDPVILTQVFVSGTEVLGDRFELVRGVIERHRVQGDRWSITVKDDSKSLITDFPKATLNLAQFPFAYEPDQVIPEAFGNLNHGPDDGDGLSAVLAPVRMTDKFALRGTSGRRKKTQGDLYQWYPDAGRLAKVVNSTANADTYKTIDVDDPVRLLVVRPIRTMATNDVTDWQDAVDGNTSTGVSITTGDNLDVYMSGSPKLGQMTAITVTITATGDYTVSIYDDTTLREGPSALNGTQVVTCLVTEWDSWELALMNVRIDGPGAGSSTINDIKCNITFNDFASMGDRAPDLWQSVVGYEDQAANYADGAVITGAGTGLRNPVHQLEAVCRDSNMMKMLEASIVSGWPDAATSRTSWLFDWPLETVQEEGFLQDFCFQAGLHLFPEEGGFSVAAMDKARTPQHFFSGDWHMPLKGGTGPDPSTWEYDFTVRPVDASEIINEVSLRYRLHGPSGEYRASYTASGQYRLTGTCSLTAAGVLTDATATFVTDEVVDQERIYISGDVDYYVDGAPLNETQLQVAVVGGGPISTIASATYYLGPNVDGTMVVSQISYKRVSALGTRQRSARDDGGYKSNFIVDADTAELFVEHIKEWFAFPRDFVSFPVHHTAVDVQLGDVVMLDHPRLTASKRPIAITTLDGAHAPAATVLAVATGTAGLFRADDSMLAINATTFQPEIMTVVSVDVAASEVTVTRGQQGTAAMSLTSGLTLYRVTVKWMVIGVRPMVPDDPVVRLRCVQMPNSYLPVGRVVYTGYPDASTATVEELHQSGWATLRNGRIWDADRDSNLSHVGPDSGTVVIV